jgi:hypothetical protein
MAYDYANLRDTVALPLIQNYGVPITLFRIEDTAVWVKSYDPVEMRYQWTNQDTLDVVYEEPEPTQVTYNGYAVKTKFEMELVDGTRIKQEDIKLIAIGIPEPKDGDIFTVSGVEYKHVSTMAVEPGPTAVIYKVQVRV